MMEPHPRTEASPTLPGPERSGHESLDVESRLRKARKIECLLGERLSGASVLDIGVGAGIITAQLARAVGRDGSVVGVDVRDSRLDAEGYGFHLVDDVRLPLGDATMDIVVSNHVIEHVGEREDQLTHLREIRRILRPGGILYLATPHRWTVIEPHFGLPFLSWLPRRAADSYVRAARKGSRYDCRLLGRRDLNDLLRRADLLGTERTLDAIAITAEVEGSRSARLVRRLPPSLQRLLAHLVPTMIFTAGFDAPSGAPPGA